TPSLRTTLPQLYGHYARTTRFPFIPATGNRHCLPAWTVNKVKVTNFFPSNYPNKLVYALIHGQAGVDIAARIDSDAVNVTAFQACNDIAFAVAQANIRGLVVMLLFGDVEDAVLAQRDVVGAAHAGPHAEQFAIRRQHLDAPVGAIGDIEF